MSWRIAILAAVVVLGIAFLFPATRTKPSLTTVVGVLDGDTLRVVANDETITIRLDGIDAPEKSQRFGGKAKQHLLELADGKSVIIYDKGRDKYGRTLAVVSCDGIDLNAQMIEAGLAWHYEKYNSDVRLAKLEEEARVGKRGLWADAMQLPPWEFRERQRTALPPVESPSASSDAAARYWLNTNTGVRHNPRCEHFQKTANGRLCGPEEGKACGICGG